MMKQIKELIIELSYNCNLSCIMCGFGQQAFDKSKFMPFETFVQIIEQIGDKADTIRLNGRGESTIHPDFIRMVDFVKQKYPEKQLNLFTNLSFNSQKIIAQFLEANFQLFISIDSPYKDELESIRRGANFDFIVRNLDKLQQLDKRPFIVFTIQELNIERLVDIADFAIKNRCNLLYNTVRRDEGIETFIDWTCLVEYCSHVN